MERNLVLITGATSGIGKATAVEFARNGWNLIITGRRLERLVHLKQVLQQEYGIDIKVLCFDVRDALACEEAVGSLEGYWSKIDVLVNNAGLAKGFDPIHKGKGTDWDQMIDTNIKGLLHMSRQISPIMVENKHGHIINVCSTAGKEVYPKGNVYCATKFAVDALTKGMRLDLYEHGIRVSQVSPAHVEETEFAYVRFEDSARAKIYDDFNPLKSPDVAEAIYFIASRPAHVNVQDIMLMGTQQAGNVHVDRSGRKYD